MQGFCRRALFGALSISVLWFWPLPAEASHEAFELYDDFSSPTILSRRWSGGETPGGLEVARIVRMGQLMMRLRREGDTASDSGTPGITANRLSHPNPSAVDQIQADFTVQSVTLTTCEANVSLGRSRPAGLALARFNDGTSTGPGDRTGDHVASVAAQRSSNAGASRALSVVASWSRCADPECSTNDFITATTLGTVQIGQTFTIRVIWDEPNNQFLYGLNDGENASLTYDVSDTAPAAAPIASVVVAQEPQNCTTGPTAADSISAVDNVMVNTSAIIP